MSAHDTTAGNPHAGRINDRVPFVELTTPFQYIGELAAPAVTAGVRALQRVWTRIGHLACVHRTERELEALDARMLKDIGIDRGQISAVARRAVDEHYARKGS